MRAHLAGCRVPAGLPLRPHPGLRVPAFARREGRRAGHRRGGVVDDRPRPGLLVRPRGGAYPGHRAERPNGHRGERLRLVRGRRHRGHRLRPRPAPLPQRRTDLPLASRALGCPVRPRRVRLPVDHPEPIAGVRRHPERDLVLYRRRPLRRLRGRVGALLGLLPVPPPTRRSPPGPGVESIPRRRMRMPRIVRGALVQAEWTGDKESMIQKHEGYAHEAAQQGAKVMCFQELFYGPYFCQVQDPQYYAYTEKIPDGPTTKRMQALARETGMVLVVPMYEEDEKTAGIYYNTAAVMDADGTYLGKYRKTHIPHVKGFWEKYYFRPGNMGYPIFDTAVGRIGVYICYDRHFPEGWRALGLAGAKIVFNPSATSRGLSMYLWNLEQPAAAVAHEYFIGAINRVGKEPLGDNDFYGSSYFVNPRGQIVGDSASDKKEEVIVRDLDMDMIEEVRQQWAFYRDRRPDAYGPLVQA